MRRLCCLLLLLSACGPVSSGGPTEECTERGAQCRLPDGPLGVCVDAEGECAEPPCLVCQPQH